MKTNLPTMNQAVGASPVPIFEDSADFSRKRGFALVIALSLMAFILLLLLSITTLARVSTVNSMQAKQKQLAQANAVLGLQIALGELQKHAGPDQRISARADILDAVPATPEVDDVAQPHWTAIWTTGPASLDVAGSAPPQRQTSLGSTTPTAADKSAAATWLVSNPDPATALNPGTWTANYPYAVTLAKDLGVDARDVAVPLVDVEGGRYGYWVSDEGVKAKVNLIDPTFNSNDAALSQLHQWNSQALPAQTILPMGQDSRAIPPAELGKVTDNASVGLLSTIDPTFTLNTYSPDITTYSYGVLSDVRHGGLKKDLTAALEDADNFNTFADTYGNGDRSLYRSGLGLTNDGPLWYSLYYYYNSYKSVMPTPPDLSPNANNPPTSSIDIDTPPYTLSPRGYQINYPDATQPSFLNGPLPVIIAYRVDIAIASYQDVNDGKWKLQLQYYPQLVLANPYSVELSLTNFSIKKGLNAFRLNELNLTVDGVALDPIQLNIDSSGAVKDRFQLRTAAGELDSLQPGETRVFALDSDIQKNSLAEASSFGALKSASNPGVSADYYQYAELSDFPGTLNGDAIVQMELSGLNSSPVGDKVSVSYLETRVFPASARWPLSSSSRYGTVASGDAFTSRAVSSVWSDRPISSLVTPYRVLGFFARRKGLAGSNSSPNYTNGDVDVPVFIGNSSVLTPFEDESSTQWMEVFLSPLGDLYTNSQTAINTFPSGETTWGDFSVGDDTSSSANRYILRDIPSQPLVSLGQFMHMPTYRYTEGKAPAGWNYNHLTFGSMFTGGSIIPVNIPPGQFALIFDPAGWTRLYLDDSFLANQALFDRFFLSTVPPASLSGTDNPPSYWTQFNADNSGSRLADATTPFLNTRIKPYFSGSLAPVMADLRDPEQAAANLMLDGAFNINSTSIPAWKALLSSLSGNRLGMWNATGKTIATLDGTALENTNPIPRFWSASSTGTPNAPWDGLRVLTDAQVNDLAEQIVAQVKTRGPFLSMADFLNRRLGSNSALTRAGALQAAIDNTSPDINQAAKAIGTDVTMSGGIPAVITANLQDADGDTLNTAVGIPGYLMQQDLVQAFSPVMTARSDTFVIRAYGESVTSATGATTGAWLEAVVQRTPEYIDQADSKLSAAGNATPAYNSDGSENVGATNLQFGRKFKIVHSRWLTSNEL